MIKGLAQKIRSTAGSLGRFKAADLADAVGIKTFRERKIVRTYISDFEARGEIERVERGVYQYTGKKQKRTQLDIVWHLVRSHRNFGADEITRLSGASRQTVLEYLLCLVRLGYLKKISTTRWILLKDPGPETPTNTAKCQRLKRLRKLKKSRRTS